MSGPYDIKTSRLNSAQLLRKILSHAKLPRSTQVFLKHDKHGDRKIEVVATFYGFSFLRRRMLERHFERLRSEHLFTNTHGLFAIWTEYRVIRDASHYWGNRLYEASISFSVTEQDFPEIKLHEGWCFVTEKPSRWTSFEAISVEDIAEPSPCAA